MKKIIACCLSVGCFLIGYLASVPIDSDSNSHRECETNALKSFEWWYSQRARPYDFIPKGAFQQASRYVRSSMKKERVFTINGVASTGWHSLGPVNIGGRTLALAVNPTNPNIVWAGAASGGLWKTTVGGQGTNAWSYVNTGFNTVSVSAVVLDPTNPSTMYIGTGEISLYHRPLIGTPGARASYGMGILKSTDAGSTWFQTDLVFSFPQITAVQRIVINPRNTNTLYAATSEGVFKSTNAGMNWTCVDTVTMAMDVALNPVDTTFVFASHGNFNSSPNPGLYRSTDAGATWTQLTSGLPTSNFGRTALSIAPSNPSVIYASIADAVTDRAKGLYRSTNSGNDWTVANTSDHIFSQGWYNNVLAVYPLNPDTIFCGGVDLFRSVDGGTTISDISASIHVDQHAIAFDPTNPRTVYFGNDGGVFKSTDCGNTFININNSYTTTQFYPGFANAYDDSTLAIGGLQDNGTLRFHGTSYWDFIYGGDGGWCAIDPSNPSVMYAESQYMSLVKSNNGGLGFSSITTGLPPTGMYSGPSYWNFIPPFVISMSDPNVLYAGSKAVYKSTNGGASWFAPNGGTYLNGTKVACIGISRNDPDVLIAATGSGALGDTDVMFEVFASTSGGQSWTNVTNSLPNRYPTDIEFDPTSETTAYITYSGYGTPHVFYTTDLGSAWIDITANLPDIPHQAVCVDPDAPENLYVGTDLGVFHSSDDGGSWEECNTGMPAAMVLDLTISRKNTALRASTFGNGVYERSLVRIPTLTLIVPNGGETWAAGYPEIIRWSEKFLDLIKLEYSIDDGTTWSLIADSVQASLGTFTWTTPETSTTEAHIRISNSVDGQPVDSSSNSFALLLNPDVVGGWNLMSIDRRTPDPRRSILFPNASSEAFIYDRRYIPADTLSNGIGFWLKFASASFISLPGDSITTDTIDVAAGWNMIGGISENVVTNSIEELPPSNVTSRYFGYRNSYQPSDTIHPKRGYWVKVQSAGKLIISASTSVEKEAPLAERSLPNTSEVTIRDATGCQQTLYFATSIPSGLIAQFELPPLPPDGGFDVRFASNRTLEVVPESHQGAFPILVQAVRFPLEIQWSLRSDTRFILQDQQHVYEMVGMGSINVSDPTSKLVIQTTPSQASSTPLTTALLPNYPNPFNPTTDLRFEIGDVSFVTLKVFDVIGREVATLVNEQKRPGNYSVRWNAAGLPSGVYFYRLTAVGQDGILSYTDTRKMLLLR